MTRNVYVASSWKSYYQSLVVKYLREAGHKVYDFKNPEPGNVGYQWSAVDPEYEQWDLQHFKMGLEHPIAREGFKLDFTAMQEADTCVLVLYAGNDSHIEAGYCVGAGKDLAVFAPGGTETLKIGLMYSLANLGIHQYLEDLENALSLRET